MKNIIVILDSIKKREIFVNSINTDTKYFIADELTIDDSLIDYVDNNTERLSFVWSFPGYYSLPFLNKNKLRTNKYFYFNDNLIDLFKKIKEKIGKSYKIDLLCCNLNNNDFKQDVIKINNDLGIEINYSTNKTGNSVDWIMESSNENIKDVYFNDNINDWDVLLDSAITGQISDGSGTVISYNSGTKTYTLLKNISWGTDAGLTYGSNVSIVNNDYIALADDEVFDGNNFVVTLLGIDGSINGLFSSTGSSFSTAPTIKNLGVGWSGGLANSAGSILRRAQKFAKIEYCYSTGDIRGSGGGVAGGNIGENGGNCSISYCYSTGNISVFAGGIVGNQAGINGGTCTITNCYSTGNIGGSGGGISGYSTGLSNGTCVITNCYSTGNISGDGGGGIVGGSATETCTISNCYSIGIIVNDNAGGVAGNNCTSTITNCYCSSSGNLVGSGSNADLTNSANNLSTIKDFTSTTWSQTIWGTDSSPYPFLKVFRSSPWIYFSETETFLIKNITTSINNIPDTNLVSSFYSKVGSNIIKFTYSVTQSTYTKTGDYYYISGSNKLIFFSLSGDANYVNTNNVYLQFTIPYANTSHTIKLFNSDTNDTYTLTKQDGIFKVTITHLSSFYIFDSDVPSSGGDPHIVDILGNHRILPNDWKYIKLYDDTIYRLIAYCDFLEKEQLNELHAIRNNQEFQVNVTQKRFRYIAKYTFYKKLLIYKHDELVAELDCIDGKIVNDNENLIKETFRDSLGLYSMVHKIHYPIKNLKSFLINLGKNYLMVDVDNYWEYINNLLLILTDKDDCYSGEFFVHSENNNQVTNYS